MPKLNVNGINLYYELQGSGPPLVLIAGFTCDILIWGPLLSELQKHFQVLTFDNRGVGQSDSPDIPYTIEMMAQDILELTKQLHLERPHVLGHSMGGCIAQTLALHHGHLFRRFVICNSLIKLNAVSTQSNLFFLHMRQANVPQRLILDGILPWIFSNQFLQDQQRIQQVIEQQMQNPHPQSLIGFKRQLEALIAFDSLPWFHKINVPTLIIKGMEDISCPHDSEKLAQGITTATLVNFPRVGHIPFIEQPEEFNRIVIEFMNRPLA